MDDWQRLNRERTELERQLVMVKCEIEQVRLGAQPDRERLHCLAQRIDGCLEKLGAVNDGLARMRVLPL